MWRNIKGCENYLVSSSGEIKSLKDRWGPRNKILKPWKSFRGYLMITLMIGGKRKHRPIHQLVLESFCQAAPSKLHQARHMDGNKLNNHYKNLTWGTVLENCLDKFKHGTARIPVHRGRGIKGLSRRWK